MGLFKKDKISKGFVKSKEIDEGIGLNTGIDNGLEKKKKESIWTKELTFKRKPRVRKEEKPERPKSVKLVSIDIGTNSIKIVEGKVKWDKIHIYKMYKIPAPKDIVQDGVIEKADTISMVVKNALKENKIKTKDLAFVSSSSTIISRVLILPFVEKKEELKNLVEYEIQQFLFINLNNYEVQSMKIENVIEDGVEKQKLLAIIYPKNIIEGYRQLTTKMFLNPYALDIANNSVRKVANLAEFFNSDLIEKEATNMFIDFGAKTTNISIINKGKLDFIRNLQLGGEEIDNFISSYKGISLEEAENFKIDNITIDKNDEISEIEEGVVRIIDDWIDDINRIIQFYANKGSGKQINHIYLYGGTSKLKGLDSYIEKRLRIPTNNIFTINNLEFDKNVTVSTVEEYVNAIGALIRL